MNQKREGKEKFKGGFHRFMWQRARASGGVYRQHGLAPRKPVTSQGRESQSERWFP